MTKQERDVQTGNQTAEVRAEEATPVARRASGRPERQNRGPQRNAADETVGHPMKDHADVPSEREAEIARNLQQVFSLIGQQPLPPGMQAIIDRMAEEEKRSK